jgi:hypothetical protein
MAHYDQNQKEVRTGDQGSQRRPLRGLRPTPIENTGPSDRNHRNRQNEDCAGLDRLLDGGQDRDGPLVAEGRLLGGHMPAGWEMRPGGGRRIVRGPAGMRQPISGSGRPRSWGSVSGGAQAGVDLAGDVALGIFSRGEDRCKSGIVADRAGSGVVIYRRRHARLLCMWQVHAGRASEQRQQRAPQPRDVLQKLSAERSGATSCDRLRTPGEEAADDLWLR